MTKKRLGLPQRSVLAKHWSLDPEIVFLNHGSFGACPTKVIETQNELRARMEAEPVRFYIRELPELLDTARSKLAAFLPADPDGLAFVTNATTGVNTALAAIPLDPGDEILVTDHGYNACRNAAEVAARRTGARLVEVPLAFPLTSADLLVEAVIRGLSLRTRVAIIDHVTSPTGLIFPIAELVSELGDRGVTVIVDGAHAPGMLDLDARRDRRGPYYTGNCHKWLCAPKGAAFLTSRETGRPAARSSSATAPTRPLGDRVALPARVRLDRHLRSHALAVDSRRHRCGRVPASRRLARGPGPQPRAGSRGTSCAVAGSWDRTAMPG